MRLFKAPSNNLNFRDQGTGVFAHVINISFVLTFAGEEHLEDKFSDFDGFQINEELVSGADENWKFMHCLPAHRGEEVTDWVMDHEQSIVFDQAENRMWAQMSILTYLYDRESWTTLAEMMGVGLWD